MAYRKDMETRKGPVGADDGSWIVISTIVGQIVHASGKDRRRFLDDAATMAAALFTPEALAFGCAYDPPRVDRSSSIAVLRLLAERMEYAGSLNLAMCVLDGMSGILPSDSVNSGRVLAQRARLSRKLGKNDLAIARYQHLRRKARKIRDNELLVRAWAGFMAFAQMRGNYPGFEGWCRRVVGLAERAQFKRLSGLGYQGLMVREALRHRFDEAINYGWSAFQAAEGHSRSELEVLTNIGRLFYDAGEPTAALDAFTTVFGSKPTLHIALTALGGHALACAAVGDRRGVAWAAAEATTLSEQAGSSYESTATLIDCASALRMIGDEPYASVMRARASVMAQYGGYHEFVHQASSNAVPAQPRPRHTIGKDVTHVARHLAALAPDALPDQLELASV